MKTAKPLCISLLLYMSMTFAGNAEETYLKAHAAYQARDWPKALSLYESINPKGPAVWYNIGNCYFNQEKFPEAIVSWRRAQKNLSWTDYKKIEQYIQDSYNAMGVNYETDGITALKNFFAWSSSKISLLILQLLFLACWFFLLWLLPQLIAQKKYVQVIALCMITAATATLCYVRYHKQNYPYGIVIKKTISVYAGPGRDYAPLATAQTLDIMRLQLQRDNWLKVYARQFGYGWVHADDLALI